MITIRIIREKMAKQEYEFAIPYFFEEMAEDDISFEDVEMAINNGRIRRKFTRDPRRTRYEVVGSTKEGREIAIICRIKSTGKLLLITTYSVEEKRNGNGVRSFIIRFLNGKDVVKRTGPNLDLTFYPHEYDGVDNLKKRMILPDSPSGTRTMHGQVGTPSS